MSACLLCECLVSAETKQGAISPVNEVACVVKCHTGVGNLVPVPRKRSQCSLLWSRSLRSLFVTFNSML